MSGKKVFGIILLLIGTSALLGLLGIHIGGIVSMAVGVLLIVYGLKQWRADREIWGGILIIIGVLFLVGSLPMLISLVIGAALVYAGYKLFTNDSGSKSYGPHEPTSTPDAKPLDDPFDEEWEKVMKSAQS
jgi:lia operon protein LiaI